MPKASHSRSLGADTSGLAAVEFAIASTVLMLGLVNGVEIARWSLQKMQVANATNSASLAVWNACDTKHLPAKTNCTGLTAAITNGLNSTSLGSGVTLASGSPTEAYYCVNGSGALQQVAAYTDAKPADCSAAGDSTRTPGDYVKIMTRANYTPLFGHVSVGGSLPSTFTSTAFIRLQ